MQVRSVVVVSAVILAGAAALILASRRGLAGKGHDEDVAPAGGRAAAVVRESVDRRDMSESGGTPGRESVAVVNDPPQTPEGLGPEPIEDGPELWENLYADATLGQIIDERRALFADLDTATESAYEELWGSGRFDYAPLEQDDDGGLRIPAGSFKSGELTSIRMDARAGLVRWVTLPRETFAAQYMQRDRIAWLMEREAQLRRAGR